MKPTRITYSLKDAENLFESKVKKVKCACYVFETVSSVEEARKFYKKLEKIKK